METRAAYVAVGTFVLALIAGLVVAVLWLAQGQFAQLNTRYDIYFASVSTGLVDGSPVRISGVQVGHVVAVALDPQNPSRVRVTVEVGSSAPIRTDSVASIEVTSLTGTAAVEITPGSKDAPLIEIKDNQRYAVIWSRESSLQQVVANVPQLLAKLTDLTDKLTIVVDDKNRAAFAATLDNLSRVTAAVAAHGGDVEHLLADGAAGAKELRKTIVSMNEAARKLDGVIAQTNGVIAQAGDTIRNVDGLVKENREPLKEFTQNGLDELRQLVGQTQALVNTMTRTVDTIERDPSRFLYGDRREGYRPQ
jgi:phospholipid/cholesterol/gamma-HCH transport system substrate-binding protein